MKPLKSSHSSLLTLDLQVSVYFVISLLCIYLGAIACLSMTTLSAWIKVMIVIFCCLNFLRILYRQGLYLANRSIISIQISPSGQWQVCLRNGNVLQATLASNSFVSAYLCLLNFKVLGYVFFPSVIIFRDTVDRDSFRRLNARLRLNY